jgi:hypothetical protein
LLRDKKVKEQLSQQAVSRRRFFKALAVIGLSVPAAHAIFDLNWMTGNQKNEVWLSAQGRKLGEFSLGWVNPLQPLPGETMSNFRGHGLCQNPAQPHQVVMLARRPGTLAIVVNLLNGNIEHTFHCAPNRNMQGHAVFSPDGKWLFNAEADSITGEGKICVRECTTFKQTNEFSSHGIGPHELAFMPDKKTLVVANGGLLTRPSTARHVHNFPTMRSTLAYIDSHNGDLISEHLVANNKASIRHLDVATDGTVAIAMQVQRVAMHNNHMVPLAAIHKPGKEIQTLQAPTPLMVKLNDYMGSVKVLNEHRIAAFTSPKGDMAMFWHLDSLKLLAFHTFHDVCGLAISHDKHYFVLSNSAGKIRQIDARTLKENKSNDSISQASIGTIIY